MKKLINFFLFIIVSVSISCITSKVQADDFVVVNGVLKQYNGTSAEITIPSIVEVIDDDVFNGNSTIRSVVM